MSVARKETKRRRMIRGGNVTTFYSISSPIPSEIVCSIKLHIS